MGEVSPRRHCASELDVSVDRVSAVGARVLLVTAGARVGALPVHHIAETMRPLPVEPVAGAPRCVRGLSVIRGAPVPVVDLPTLLGGRASAAPVSKRFVTVKVGERRLALAVDSVLGVEELEGAQLDELPPLLRHADLELVEAIGVVDAQLLVVLRGARILSDEVWEALEAGAASR